MRLEISLQQTCPANPFARNIVTVNHPVPIENGDGRVDGHLIVLMIESGCNIMNRSLNFALLIRHVPQKQINVADQLDRRVVSVDEEILNPGIGVIEQQFAFCRLAVAPGSARFLVIRLERARDLKMNHKPQISPIDAHPESVGRHSHIAVVLRKSVLRFFAAGVINSAMITDDPNPP